MIKINEPQTEKELLDRAYQISGYSIQDICNYLNIKCEKDFSKNKGFVGNIIEIFLGAKAGNKAEQDFKALGIELKTIPINTKNIPTESTFVCLAPFTHNIGVTWETSHIKTKLSKVLFIPILSEKKNPITK